MFWYTLQIASTVAMVITVGFLLVYVYDTPNKALVEYYRRGDAVLDLVTERSTVVLLLIVIMLGLLLTQSLSSEMVQIYDELSKENKTEVSCESRKRRPAGSNMHGQKWNPNNCRSPLNKKKASGGAATLAF